MNPRIKKLSEALTVVLDIHDRGEQISLGLNYELNLKAIEADKRQFNDILEELKFKL